MELTTRAIELAGEAAGTGDGVLVAGSVGPLADCYRADLVPDDTVLSFHQAARIGLMAAVGVDLLMIETMNTIREAVASLQAAHDVLPAMVSFVCGPDANLLSGESLADAVRAIDEFDPAAILVNCCAPAVATKALMVLRDATDRPVGAYANGRGRPDDTQGWCFEGGVDDETYLAHVEDWIERGAAVIGGCCGTTPATIALIAERLRREP